MKKALLIFALFFMAMSYAQEQKLVPMISVSGEGKVKIAPDQASISISIETKGTKADDVKKENDKKMDAILKFIKKSNIAKEDFQTQRVSLNSNYDYEKKKHNYIATQSVQILLKDLSKYDELMEGLVDEGINRIDNVEFKSSKMKDLQSDARKLAIKEAKGKAEDFVSVLGQKVGKALLISDNSQNYNPHPVMYAMKSMAMDESAPRETLAVGEIEITANVSVSFILE
ncbi:SIMPL domain-containing protein [Flavobacterium soyangense]|uniref:SIMPL domain-containing protein n=1 Tax=Flavobacterium soyangense TaxID=2023265 RepID=A0A930U6C1_9FLAO|nr:SIMPL domain-containing protein [Flavobacterium soyangense]MBF2707708.1 SIMPL domain-containing protein [Flavobacterium soyangense]